MTPHDILSAIEAIRLVKARYMRGVDTADGDLVRSILAPDCVLDYRGCCTDPQSGTDFLPPMNVVLEGRDSWVSDAFEKAGVASVHQAHQHEITVESATSASAIWAFTDRMYFPAGGAFRTLEGFGHYHDTYRCVDGTWLLQTTRITRLKVITT